MAIPHVLPGQVVDVMPLGLGMASSSTTALFKSRDIEVIRLILMAGNSLPPHRVPGEITIQCIEGAVRIAVEGVDSVLLKGQMLYLLGNALHSVHALEDASALVTVALTK